MADREYRARMLLPRFYASDGDFERIHHSLKLYPCPRCHRVGCLILHGFLSGYDESVGNQRVIRGHRVFCSNRKRRKGCGRTFGILIAWLLRKSIYGAHTVWVYFMNVVSGMSKARAMREVHTTASPAVPYNLWRRLSEHTVHIRTHLSRLIPPPDANSPSYQLQTVRHLEAAFLYSANPLVQFQLYFQLPFFSI